MMYGHEKMKWLKIGNVEMWSLVILKYVMMLWCESVKMKKLKGGNLELLMYVLIPKDEYLKMLVMLQSRIGKNDLKRSQLLLSKVML